MEATDGKKENRKKGKGRIEETGAWKMEKGRKNDGR